MLTRITSSPDTDINASERDIAVKLRTLAEALPVLRRSLLCAASRSPATVMLTGTAVSLRAVMPTAGPSTAQIRLRSTAIVTLLNNRAVVGVAATPVMATKPPVMPHPRSTTVDPGPHCSVTFTSRSATHQGPSITTVLPASIETFCSVPGSHRLQSVFVFLGDITDIACSARTTKTSAALSATGSRRSLALHAKERGDIITLDLGEGRQTGTFTTRKGANRLNLS